MFAHISLFFETNKNSLVTFFIHLIITVLIIKYNFIFILQLTFQRSNIEFLDIEGVPVLPTISTLVSQGQKESNFLVRDTYTYTHARAHAHTYICTQREGKVLHGRAGVIDLIPRENWRRGNRLGKGLSIRRFRHLSLCSSVSRLGREG